MLEDQQTIQVSRTQIKNWENDMLFTDGMKANTDPELDPDRTVGSTLSPEEAKKAADKTARTNQRLIIVNIRKMAYDLEQKTKLDKEQNLILKPIYNISKNFKIWLYSLIGLMATALALGIWSTFLAQHGVGS